MLILNNVRVLFVLPNVLVGRFKHTLLTLLQAEHQTSDIHPAHSTSITQEVGQHLPTKEHSHAVTQAEEPVAPQAELRLQNSKGQLLKHINFWHEDELKMAHPEVQVQTTFMFAAVPVCLFLHLCVDCGQCTGCVLDISTFEDYACWT